MSDEDVKKRLGLPQMAKTNLHFQQCSALTGDGIWEGIAQLANMIDEVEKNGTQISASHN